MKLVVATLFFLAISSTAIAGVPSGGASENTPAQKLALVKKMAADQVKQDFRTKVTLVEEGICGAEGPSYIVDIEMKKSSKTMGKDGQIKLVTKWQTVKTYGATSAELGGPITPGLMDSENCLE